MEDQFSRLLKAQEDSLEVCLQNSAKWQKFREDYAHLQKRLDSLADHIDYNIMVPLGAVAFVPGKLIHTNEILVLLGENTFVERSSKQASEIVGRRIKDCDAQLDKLKQEQKQLENWSSYTKTIREESGLVDIVEEYDEQVDKEWRERRKKCKSARHTKPSSDDELSFEKIMERLDELELEELSDGENNRQTRTIESEEKLKEESIVKTTYQSVENQNHFQFTSPADIYKYCQSLGGFSTCKSILKKSKESVDSSNTRAVLLDNMKKIESPSRKVTFKSQQLNSIMEDTLSNCTNEAFSDVVVEREPHSIQNAIRPNKSKRVSLFKANKHGK